MWWDILPNILVVKHVWQRTIHFHLRFLLTSLLTLCFISYTLIEFIASFPFDQHWKQKTMIDICIIEIKIKWKDNVTLLVAFWSNNYILCNLLTIHFFFLNLLHWKAATLRIRQFVQKFDMLHVLHDKKLVTLRSSV